MFYHNDNISAAAFIPDNKQLLSVSKDETIHIRSVDVMDVMRSHRNVHIQ